MSESVLVGFSSGKGSPGATWCVANIGVALARAGQDPLALDLDLSGGVLSAHLGLGPGRGLYPLCRIKGPRPTAGELRDEIEVRNGLRAIAGIPRARDAASIDVVAVATAARELASTVLVDGGRLPGPAEDALLLGACDRIVLVVAPTPPGLLAAEQALAHLGGAVAKRVGVLVSGLARRRVGDLTDVRSLLGCPVLGTVPLVPVEARRAAEAQRPVSGPAAKAFARLGASLTGAQEVEARWQFGLGEGGVGDAA